MMNTVVVAMMAIVSVGTVFANPPNPKVSGDMFGVKKVQGNPDFAQPPQGAEVLFDGTMASAEANWVAEKPKEKGGVIWPVKEGVWIDTATDLLTKKEFGSVQMHLEWRVPKTAWLWARKGRTAV